MGRSRDGDGGIQSLSRGAGFPSMESCGHITDRLRRAVTGVELGVQSRVLSWKSERWINCLVVLRMSFARGSVLWCSDDACLDDIGGV